MPRAKAQEEYYTNKELVYEAIKNRLKKGQALEEITNNQIMSDIEKKHDYELVYKTASSYKSTFKKDNIDFLKKLKSKEKTKPQPSHSKTLAMKHRKNEPTPKAIYIESSEEEFNELARENNLIFAGMVFKVDTPRNAKQPKKFVFWNNSKQPTGKTTTLIPMLEA